MRITQRQLYGLSNLKKVEIIITLDNVYITYKKKEHQFTGSNKNKKAFNFLNSIA